MCIYIYMQFIYIYIYIYTHTRTYRIERLGNYFLTHFSSNPALKNHHDRRATWDSFSVGIVMSVLEMNGMGLQPPSTSLMTPWMYGKTWASWATGRSCNSNRLVRCSPCGLRYLSRARSRAHSPEICRGQTTCQLHSL